MQKDVVSCGIFAVMRAYFILSNTLSKINTDVARSHLSSVLAKHEFTDYDIFSSRYKNIQMQVIMENYMSNQKELQSKNTHRTVHEKTEMLSQVVEEDTGRKRGRPRKRKYLQEEVKAASDLKQTISYDFTCPSMSKRGRPAKSVSPVTVCHDVTAAPVRKKGRPAKLSQEEKIKRIKESKLKHYHKTKGSCSKGTPQKRPASFPGIYHIDSMNDVSENVTASLLKRKHSEKDCAESPERPIKRGRPAMYSPEEKILRDREKRLRHYHKSMTENTTETVQILRDRHKEDLMLLRSSAMYKDRERGKDQERHQNMRQNPAFREKERDKDRESHRDMRNDPTFRDMERAKDRESHKNMRKNPAVRDKERQWHKDMRENPAVRDKERDKDRQSHKDVRRNPAVRDKEKQWHKDMRENPEYRNSERKRDRESRKNMRKNPAVRDKERDKDRQWHQESRADLVRRERENLNAYKRKYGENEQDAIKNTQQLYKLVLMLCVLVACNYCFLTIVQP